MTVVEEQRCRGTAMGDTAATPTRRHRQPNRQLSLASTPPPPPYRGMPTTQPQSMCVRARPPHAWELPTREKSKIGLGSQVPCFNTIQTCRFLPPALGGGTRTNSGGKPAVARAVEASLLWPGGQQGQANHSSERQHQLRPECQQWQGPQALARGKTSATRSPTEANPHALEPRSKPAAARRPTVARPASPGNGQAVCGPKAGTSKPACPRAQRQAHCGPKTNNGKPAEPPPHHHHHLEKGASQLRWPPVRRFSTLRFLSSTVLEQFQKRLADINATKKLAVAG